MQIEEVIAAVQKKLGGQVDGRAGPETWAAIYSSIVKPKPPLTQTLATPGAPMKVPLMRHSTFWLCFVTILNGCAQQPIRGEKFISNERSYSAAPEQLRKLRAAWASSPLPVLATSKISSSDQQWVLDFIAFTHSSTIGTCEKLVLLERADHPLAPFTILAGYNGQKITYRPRKYHESWYLQACGEKVEWRVIDDPDEKQYQEITPLLWKRG